MVTETVQIARGGLLGKTCDPHVKKGNSKVEIPILGYGSHGERG